MALFQFEFWNNNHKSSSGGILRFLLGIAMLKRKYVQLLLKYGVICADAAA